MLLVEAVSHALTASIDVIATVIAWALKLFLAWQVLEVVETKVNRQLGATAPGADVVEARQWRLRLQTLLHASLGCVVCSGYLLGFLSPAVLSWARAVSTVYLVREMLETWRYFGGLTSSSAAPPNNCLVQTLHHVLTIAILYEWLGFTLGRSGAGHYDGLLLYYWGEPPIVLMQYAWFLSKTGQEHLSLCLVSSQLVLPTWLFFRLFSFGVVLVFVYLPTCSIWSFGSWLSLALLCVVYGFNTWWFCVLLSKRAPSTPASDAAEAAASPLLSASPFLAPALARLPMWQVLQLLAVRVSKWSGLL